MGIAVVIDFSWLFLDIVKQVGTKLEQFDVPVCNIFQNKIVNDQLCYEADVNKFSNKENIQNELKLGFAFTFFYNEDMQTKDKYVDTDGKSANDSLITKMKTLDKKLKASIYLNTIGK